jgi:hypothetical protein
MTEQGLEVDARARHLANRHIEQLRKASRAKERHERLDATTQIQANAAGGEASGDHSARRLERRRAIQ